jgi:hypothetical protein
MLALQVHCGVARTVTAVLAVRVLHNIVIRMRRIAGTFNGRYLNRSRVAGVSGMMTVSFLGRSFLGMYCASGSLPITPQPNNLSLQSRCSFLRDIVERTNSVLISLK